MHPWLEGEREQLSGLAKAMHSEPTSLQESTREQASFTIWCEDEGVKEYQRECRLGGRCHRIRGGAGPVSKGLREVLGGIYLWGERGASVKREGFPN